MSPIARIGMAMAGSTSITGNAANSEVAETMAVWRRMVTCRAMASSND